MSCGEKYIHVYEIELQTHELPSFYLRDDCIATLCSDVNYPYRNGSITLIGSSTSRAVRSKPLSYKCSADRFIVPYFGVREFEYEEVMKDNTVAAIQACLDLDDVDNRSVFVVRHKFEDDIWEMGICVRIGYGGERFTRNDMFEEHINRVMNLKAFW